MHQRRKFLKVKCTFVEDNGQKTVTVNENVSEDTSWRDCLLDRTTSPDVGFAQHKFRSLSQDCSGVEIALQTRHHIGINALGDALSDRAPHKVKLDDTIADSLKVAP